MAMSFVRIVPIDRKELQMTSNNQWLKDQKEYLEKQAPLRAAWLNGDEDAGRKLKELVAEYTAKQPPLAGTFSYTQEQVEQARRAGLSDEV
jgi:hypothetical protein